MPDPDGLIVGAAGDELTAGAYSSHPDPLPVSGKSLYAVASRYLPDLDGLVARRADNEVALWHERHRADVVVVAVHRFYAGERLLKVPQLYGHIRAAGDEQLPACIERYVLHTIRVTLERSFELACLEVPHL